MDAAYKSLTKTAVFLATALLLAVPGRAQQLIVSSSTVALNDNQARSISVTASGANAVTYTVSGVPFWLSTFSTNGFTTPDTLAFQLSNTNCGTCSAPITLSAAGSAPVTVTVTFSPGSTGGSGTLTASPGSLTFSAFSGQTATSQTVTLSTATSSSVNIVGISSDQSWLTAAVTSGSFTVTSSLSATLTVQASAATLSNGTYTGHVTVTPGVGTATQITVTFNVGSGGGSTGTIVPNPTSLTFSASAGQSTAIQTVSLTTSNGSSATIIGIVPDVTWLALALTSTTVSSASPATLSVQANAGNLANGSYTGHITITPATGTQTVITVTFNVGTGGGTTGTIVPNPTSLTFSAAAGQASTVQTVSLTTNNGTSVTILGIVPDVTWIALALTSTSVSSIAPATLSVQANAGNLANGSYTGHITITPSSGTQTVITVTFNVGTGGSSGTITASPSSLSFSAQSGQVPSAQTVSLTTTGSSVTIIGINFDATWLSASVISGSFTVSPTASATLQVQPSAVGLANGSYTGHITITPSSGTQTVITVTFNVGSGGGGGTGTITASNTSFQFAYPSSTLSAQLTVGSNNASVTSFNVAISSQSNWLLFQGVTGGPYTGVGFGTYSITVNQTVASGLPTGTYSGTITLTNPQNSSDITTVNLTLTVNGGSGGGGSLSASPTAVNFTASPGGAAQSQNLTITAPSGSSLQFTAQSFNGAFFSVSSTGCSGTPNPTLNCTFTGGQTLTITVNPGSLTTLGAYTGSLTFTSGTTTLPVYLTLNLIAPVNSLTVTPTALSFTAAPGGASQTQSVSVAVPNNALVQASLTSFNGNFFTVTSSNCNSNPSTSTICSFNGDQTLNVTVNPSGLTTQGNYNGTIVLQSGGQTITVTVALTLVTGGGGGNTGAIAAPASLAFAYQTTSANFVPQQVITVGPVGTFTATATVSTSQQWLVVSSVGTSGPGFVVVSVAPQGLTVGTYTGTVTINSASGAIGIPVTLTVTTNVVVQSNPGNIYFQYQGGAAAVTQSLTISASDNSTTPVTFSTSTPWISVGTPTSATTPSTVTLTINPASLCNGLNTGSVTISAPNAANNGLSIPVVALVSGSTASGCSSTGGGSSLTVTPTSLTFAYAPGGSTPVGQTLGVSSSAGAAGVSFTYSYTGNVPLTATVILNGAVTTIQNGQTLTTPATITVTPSVSGVAAGQTYTSSITLAPSGGNAVSVPVTLTVSAAAAISASPTNLTFTYSAGSAAPNAQTVQVSGGSGQAFSATATSSGNWLSVSPTAGTTPASLSVSVNPTGLAANTYTGTVTITGTGTATGSVAVTVTLTVTAPLPTITSIGSAASYLGGSLSPGEIITIFGTSIGPTPGVTLTLDSTGKVATSLGGVQVLVNGFQSPMVFASNTQVSAVVPYEICANSCGPGTIAQVVVKFLGQSSNGIPTPVAATTTAVFTANASGSGPGAILNANLSANSPGNPANKGDIVAIYLTGEGLTSPTGVTGKVTTVSSTPPLTPVPLLPVGVLIDGQPVSMTFAGEAPGLVSGAMQLNVQIPATARSGALPLTVTIGGVSSQAGVTVSVK